MVPEARLEQTAEGLVPQSDGWFVLNARDARWQDRGPRGKFCEFEGDATFPQLGINLFVLEPGQPMAVYHWEADQEDFLVLHGEALLIVEGEERPLKAWDLVHCPAHASHVILGAGDGPAVILAVGARDHSTGEGWGAYPVDPVALLHGAGAESETTEPQVAYARFPKREPAAYHDGWLP
jgi:uncharacterized cupin superfamily protein